MTPWTRARWARYIRRYLAVDSRRFSWRAGHRPWWQWAAFRAVLWAAWRFRWTWLPGLALWICHPKWVGMDGEWEPWCRGGNAAPF